MSEVYVIRIQDKWNSGPYRGRSANKLDRHWLWSQYNFYCQKRHPTVNDEILYHGSKFWKCGFSSTKQLFDWFNDECLHVLDECGFRAVIFKTRESDFGDKQLTFNVLKSEKVNDISLKDLIAFRNSKEKLSLASLAHDSSDVKYVSTDLEIQNNDHV